MRRRPTRRTEGCGRSSPTLASRAGSLSACGSPCRAPSRRAPDVHLLSAIARRGSRAARPGLDQHRDPFAVRGEPRLAVPLPAVLGGLLLVLAVGVDKGVRAALVAADCEQTGDTEENRNDLTHHEHD